MTERTAADIRAEIKALQDELRFYNEGLRVGDYIKEYPYYELDIRTIPKYDRPYVEIDGAIFHLWGNGSPATKELRALCRLAFAHYTDKRRPEIRSFDRNKTVLFANMFNEMTEVYNKYWVKIREEEIKCLTIKESKN